MLSLILITLLLFILVVMFLYKKNYWKKRNVVQVNGTSLKFLFGNRPLAEIYKDIYDRYRTEPYVGVYEGTLPALLLRDTENIQAVLAGDFQSFNSRGIVLNPKDILSDSLLFIDDYDKWKLIRQKMTPIFTSFKLKNMFYLMEKCARDFVDVIRTNDELMKIPYNGLYAYTTAAIGATVFGVDIKPGNNGESPFLNLVLETSTPTFKQNVQFILGGIYPDFVRRFNLKVFGDHGEFFISFFKSVLQKRKLDISNIGKSHDFIDICIELQNSGTMQNSSGYELETSEELLAAQAFFYFVAGVDTSASTMHFTLLELSQNKKILNKLHEEIDNVFVECNERLAFDDVEKLHYLDMVLSESMRKYPSIGILRRKCTKDTVLPVGNLKIEKNTKVVLPVYAIHRDEKYYPNPELFDPERFSSNNIEKRNKFCFLPFGEGNRACIGTRYARLQAKAGLAWLLRKYTLKEQGPPHLTFESSPFAVRATDAKYEIIPRNEVS